ncbi:MAG: GNAT family N-acetyltransferase [Pseudooceanicola sp.]|nr:GNAT family N-acetyltransferase [Pseudooceanicola sp.]
MGEILWRFQHQHDWMPVLYSLGECVTFCRQMIERGWCTVAEIAGEISGFLARDAEEICALYVATAAQRRGAGHALLDHAKGECGRLHLRCVEPNTAARRFYAAQGFAVSGPAERKEDDLPGFTYVWQGATA